MSRLNLHILGGFELFADDHELTDLSAKKAKALLAYLVCQEGRSLSRDQLAALLWPNSDDRRARHSLSQALSSIRQAFETADADGLSIETHSVRLAPGALDVDVRRFVELASKPERESLEAAAALYRGDLLEGLSIGEPGFQSWLHGERPRLRVQAVQVLAGLLDIYADSGCVDDIVATALRLLTVDPLDERAHRALIEAYANQGNTQAALCQFRKLEKLLKAELQTEPEAETRRLRQAIVHGRIWGEEGQTMPGDKDAVDEEAPPGPSCNRRNRAGGSWGALPVGAPNTAIASSSRGLSTHGKIARIRSRSSLSFRVAAAVFLALIAVGAIWWQPWVPETDADLPPTMSIVVLPFDNPSGDASQDYLADGITEDLITDLSRIRDAFVIARGTSFTYKGKTVNAKDVAKELNVRYVLEGSVRRSGDQVRVNVQLIDGETGSHVWSNRFDREYKNVFSLQNDITGRLASVLKGELLEAESRRVRQGSPANLAAWDFALQGWVDVYVIPQQTSETLKRAKSHFEKAIEIDPTLGLAWTGLAQFYYKASTVGVAGYKRSDARKKLMALAKKAAALSPNDADALVVLGLAYRINRSPAKALSACQSALKFNPNHEEANVCIGMALMALGRTAETIPYLQKGAQLNPYQRPFRLYFFRALARLLERQYDEAINLAQRGIASNPRFIGNHAILASALAWAGRIPEARKSLKEVVVLDPTRYSVTAFRQRSSYFSPKYEIVLEGFRRAGAPEK